MSKHTTSSVTVDYANLRKDYDYLIGLINAHALCRTYNCTRLEQQHLLTRAYQGLDIDTNDNGLTDPDGYPVNEIICNQYPDNEYISIVGELYDSDDMEPPFCADASDIKRLHKMFSLSR